MSRLIRSGDVLAPDWPTASGDRWRAETWAAWRCGFLFRDELLEALGGITRQALLKLIRSGAFPPADGAIGRRKVWRRETFEAAQNYREDRRLERALLRREAEMAALAAEWEAWEAGRLEREAARRALDERLAREAEEAITRQSEANSRFLAIAKERARRARPPGKTWWEQEEARFEPKY